jgi:predicted protein tyrosine phosphatase
MNVLFLCSRNRLRSPTAEEIFAGRPGIEVASAGIAPDAVERVSSEHVEWADIIFVMGRTHKTRLARLFGQDLKGKKIVCLDIPDNYGFMQPELVAILEKKVARLLDVWSRTIKRKRACFRRPAFASRR